MRIPKIKIGAILRKTIFPFVGIATLREIISICEKQIEKLEKKVDSKPFNSNFDQQNN